MEDIKKDGKANDAELENVAGGDYNADDLPSELKAWKDGRDVQVPGFRCPNCGCIGSTYSTGKDNIRFGPDVYRSCKCYECGKVYGDLNA